MQKLLVFPSQKSCGDSISFSTAMMWDMCEVLLSWEAHPSLGVRVFYRESVTYAQSCPISDLSYLVLVLVTQQLVTQLSYSVTEYLVTQLRNSTARGPR